jgi:hypothetical protein
VREIQAVEPGLAAEAFSHAAEDLAGDHPGVATGTHERPEADGGRHSIRGLAGDRLCLIECRTDRRHHVRTRVAIGHGVHVEGVDLVDARLEVRDGRPEGFEQSGAVAGATDHQATSVPLSARSRGRIALGSAGMTEGGAAPGATRSPPMLIVRRAISRPMPRRMA